jgi:hypothetical protein
MFVGGPTRDDSMASIQKRIAFGFVAAVISVLIFHQGMWTTLHYLNLPGLGMPPPFPMDPVPPFGVPRIVSLCFWGGVWGALFGAVWHGRRSSTWWAGILLGIIAGAFGLLVVLPLKGLPFAGGWVLNNWIKSMLINGTWGLGVGLLLTVLPDQTASRDSTARA